MPRPQRPLDPDAGGALARWAADLRALREAAGNPGYRDLARRAHFSYSSLADAAGGQKLPSLAVATAYVRACGGDVDQWRTRWRVLAAELAADTRQPEPCTTVDDVVSPYRGLAAFQIADADWFFGRTDLVQELADRIAERRFVGVFGPSGSGKSSLLRAGLVPALAHPVADRPTWPTVVFTPGDHPLTECAIHLAKLLRIPAGEVRADLLNHPDHLHLAARQVLLDRPGDVDLVVVVDQFEEVFTLCTDPAERAAFITALTTAATAPGSRLRVVLGVRADFYGRCAEYGELVVALRDSQLLVGAMLPEELRAAITAPARRVGLTVEATLVSTIISQMLGRPGALPLMSHALVETWRRRRGTTLGLAGYDACGGIDGAIQQSAESVYATLTDIQQDRVRELLLRLTTVGQDGPDTARRVRRTELGEDPGMTEIVAILADARLITVGTDSVEIAHEALIRSWRRLRDWLDQDREGLRLHRQLTDDARLWESLGRDPGALYRGVRLATVQDWDNNHRHTSLTKDEETFLQASITAYQRELRMRRRRTRRLWTLVGGLTMVTCVAVVATVMAVQQRADADTQRRQASSHDLATRSSQLMTSGDPTGARVLALAAWAEAPTAEARNAILSVQTPETTLLASAQQAARNQDPVWSTTVSADGRTRALGMYNGSVLVSEVQTGRQLMATSATGSAPENLPHLALSANGRWLATASLARPTQVWDTATGKPVIQLPATLDMIDDALAYSPDGHTLAESTNTRIMLWDTTTWHLRATLNDADAASYAQRYDGSALAFTSDSRFVAQARADSITVWDGESGRQVASLRHPGAKLAAAMALGRDWHTVVAQTFSNTIVLWQPANGQTVLTLQETMGTEAELITYNAARNTVSAYSFSGIGMVYTWQTDFDTVYHQLCIDTADGAILPDHWNQIADGIPRPIMCQTP